MPNLPPKLVLVASQDLDDKSVTPSPDASGFAPKLTLVTTDRDLGYKADDPSPNLCERLSEADTLNSNDNATDRAIPPLDWYDWSRGVGFGPLDGIDNVISEARISVEYYLPWRTLPDGTRTHHIDGTDEQARIDFWGTLSGSTDRSALFRGDWTVAERITASLTAQRATRDRVLLAAARAAHDNDMCMLSFLESAAKAFAFIEQVAFEDDDKDFDDSEVNGDDLDPDHDH